MNLIRVTVSGPMLRQMFHPCEANFIKGTCRGRCCEGGAGKIVVHIHASEKARIEAKGATVVGGFIRPDARGLCPFKTDDGFCGIHGPEKPFGCQASPFMLTSTDLLVVRNRYRKLPCFKCEGSLPAYDAHRWSLDRIFGEAEAGRIAQAAAEGQDRFERGCPLCTTRCSRIARRLWLVRGEPPCGPARRLHGLQRGPAGTPASLGFFQASKVRPVRPFQASARVGGLDNEYLIGYHWDVGST